jgi:hypothetical protein
MPQIPVLLETQPKVSGHPENPRQTQGGVRRYAPLPTDDLIQAGEGYAQPHGKCRLANLERLEEFL